MTAGLHGLNELGVVACLIVAECDLFVSFFPVLDHPGAVDGEAVEGPLDFTFLVDEKGKVVSLGHFLEIS